MQERHYVRSNLQQLRCNLFCSSLTGLRTRGGALVEMEKLGKI